MMDRIQVTHLLSSPVLIIAFVIGLKFLTELYCLIYNVYFSPCANFPGPRLAAATSWWKTYVEVWQGINMTDILPGLHEKYGKSNTIYRTMSCL